MPVARLQPSASTRAHALSAQEHGAFVYFFNDENEHARDCYFLIDVNASQTEVDASSWQPFTISEEHKGEGVGQGSEKGCCTSLWSQFRSVYSPDRVTKAEALCLLQRPLAKEWVVKVRCEEGRTMTPILWGA